MFKLIKYEKDNCIACNIQENLLNKSPLKKHIENGLINFEKINSFDKPELAIKNKIRTNPTLILYKIEEDGKHIEKARWVGATEQGLNDFLGELNEIN